jgi:DNA-binding CsgD family transcriptional regulator
MKWIDFLIDWWEERKYTDEVKKLIRAKRKRVNFHKKKLKIIKKHNGSERSIKTHRYMVNKLTREIEGIKEHYKKNIEYGKK